MLDKFSCDIIAQAWSSHEMEAIMKFHHKNRYYRLELLKKAQKYRQVFFVAQPNCQQMLTRVWYGELSYLRCQPAITRLLFGFLLGAFWPVWSIAYLVCPNTAIAKSYEKFKKFCYIFKYEFRMFFTGVL